MLMIYYKKKEEIELGKLETNNKIPDMDGKTSISLKKTAILITIIIIGCKLFGFGREIAISYFFGTSNIVDAFLMASSIPEIFFGWLGAIVIAYTPKFTEVKCKDGLEASQKYSNNIITFLEILCLICVCITFIWSDKFVVLAAPGFEGETFALANRFLKVSIFAILLEYLNRILISFLNCNDKFLQSNVSMLMVSSSQLIVIVLVGIFNRVDLMIYCVIASVLLQFLVLLIFSSKENFKYRPELKFNDDLKLTMKFVIPIFLSSMIAQINTFVDKVFASNLAVGSISALNYADKIKLFIVSIFSIAIVTIIFPVLSKAVFEKRIDDVKDIFSRALNMIILMFVPITIGAILLAKPAMTVIYMRGMFDARSLDMTTVAFTMYTVGLMFVALRDVITRVFYSLQDTKAVLVVGVIAVALNIGLNFVLVKIMGHAGLALSTSISAIISFPLFLYFLRRRLGALGMGNSLRLFFKAMISSAVMGIVVYLINGYFAAINVGTLYSLISIIVCGFVGAIIYYGVMKILKVEEMKEIDAMFIKVASKFGKSK